jgi:outer membrane lipoprotein SlyB
MKRNLSIAAITATAMLSGCAGIPLSSTRFSGSSNLAPESVQTGVVLRTMPIKINNSARVDQATGLGAGAGGLVGYLAGGNVIGALAGALGGGVIGDAITPNSGVGTDVFVKLSTGQTLSIPEAGIVHLTPGEHVFVMTSAHGHYRVEPANQSSPTVKP